MKKFLKVLNNFICLIIVFSTIFIFSYVSFSLSTMNNPQISEIKNPSYTQIYSENGDIVETIGKDKKQYVEYENIPKPLVYALISIEDSTFFEHEGIDYRRTFQAFIHNLTSKSKHGGSTITQQLVKNIYLTDKQSYERKIQEAFLSYKLEKILTKEQILEQYFNYVYFEPTIPGVVYASRYYFNKELEMLNLPEMATLAGLVKSASFYNPLKYPNRADERKNLTLKAMFEQKYISENVYNACIAKHVSTFLNVGKNTKETFPFQAYLDVVYLQAKELLNIDVFTNKLEIHTYLDTSLQNYLDEIQSGKAIKFYDDDQQLGACVLRNEDAAIKGVIGGRFYQGSRLFSHAYSMKRQPASTIKPVFGYLLAVEHLNYNNTTTVKDEEYFYPNTNFSVANADKYYAGLLSMEEAIGYSKNTSALYTLENVIQKIGIKKVIEHLNNLDLMDDGTLTYAYAIGGYSNGISPTQLAGAYRVLNAKGNYLKPSTIKYIKDATTGKIIYSRELKEKNVVSESSAFIMQDTLKRVVKNNYYNIGVLGIDGYEVGGKTGTNGFDSESAKKLNYPLSADKDTWVAGFTNDYTLTIWSGFDTNIQNGNTYFGKNDLRRFIPKEIFPKILKKVTVKKDTPAPDNLIKISVVKNAIDYYLPNKYIPQSHIIEGYFKKDNLPKKILPDPSFPTLSNFKLITFPNEIIISFDASNMPNEPFNYEKIFSAHGYLLSYIKDGRYEEVFTPTNHIILNEDIDMISNLTLKPCFLNNTKIASITYDLTPNDIFL